MKINNFNNIKAIKDDGLNKVKENMDTKNVKDKTISSNKDEFIKSDYSNSKANLYNKKISTHGIGFDKGTAAETTVHVNRAAFDRIVNATTHGDTKWEELGVDDNKRWVVVNGQRFEVEHTAAEKAKRKEAQKTLIDFMNEADERIRERNKGQDNGLNKPKGNIDALKNNKEVMDLLGRIFNTSTYEETLSKLV